MGGPGSGPLVAGYVEVIRNTPLLVQLFIVFFGLPSLGVRLDAMTAAFIALSVNLGAYSTEIVRAGLEAVPRAQIEAGHSLGLSGVQVFRHVVLAPALGDRLPSAHQPIRADDAGDQRGVADLGARPVPRRLDHPVAHLPRFRGLRRDRRRLSCAGTGIQTLVRRDRALRFRPPMIREFALIDVYYLLLAARWTLALTGLPSWAAACVGLLVALLRVAPFAPLRLIGAGYVHIVQGIAAAGLAVRALLRLADLRLRGLALDRGDGRLLDLCRRLPGRDLARRSSGDPAPAMGGRRLARPQLRRAAALHHRAAGSTRRHPADRRLSRAAHQEHVAGRGDRLRRADARRPAHHRRDLPALYRLHHRRRALFRYLLPADAVEPRAWKGRSMSLVELHNVVKRFGAHTVLDGVSLVVEAGEIIAIIGRSGSGKSTLLRCINGLEPIQDGRIVFDGETVNDPATNLRKLRQRVGIVFQSYNLFPHLSVERNITLAPRW